MPDPTVTATPPGIYGKVHTLGDFVLRDLPHEFVQPWDDWLRLCLAQSRDALGERWLDHYLVCPVWRFGLAAGLCGGTAWVGLIMPSVDHVGRYFPLTIAASVDDDAMTTCFTQASAWFSSACELLTGTLDDDFQLEVFHAALRRLGPPPSPGGSCSAPARRWALRFQSDTSPAAALGRMAPGLLARSYSPVSLWWAELPDDTPRHMLVCSGMPQPEAFTTLLTVPREAGSWTPCEGRPDS